MNFVKWDWHIIWYFALQSFGTGCALSFRFSWFEELCFEYSYVKHIICMLKRAKACKSDETQQCTVDAKARKSDEKQRCTVDATTRIAQYANIQIRNAYFIHTKPRWHALPVLVKNFNVWDSYLSTHERERLEFCNFCRYILSINLSPRLQRLVILRCWVQWVERLWTALRYVYEVQTIDCRFVCLYCISTCCLSDWLQQVKYDRIERDCTSILILWISPLHAGQILFHSSKTTLF